MLKLNQDYKILEAKEQDAKNLLQYLKIVGGQTNNLSFDENGIGISEEQQSQILRNYEKNKDGVLLVAKIGDEIISYANSAQFINNKKQTHVFKMSISVDKRYWRNGIAQNMLLKILELAKQRGCKKMILFVNTKNVAAIELYKKHEFEVEGTLKNNIKTDGQYLDDYLMSKWLDNSTKTDI